MAAEDRQKALETAMGVSWRQERDDNGPQADEGI